MNIVQLPNDPDQFIPFEQLIDFEEVRINEWVQTGTYSPSLYDILENYGIIERLDEQYQSRPVVLQQNWLSLLKSMGIENTLKIFSKLQPENMLPPKTPLPRLTYHRQNELKKIVDEHTLTKFAAQMGLEIQYRDVQHLGLAKLLPELEFALITKEEWHTNDPLIGQQPDPIAILTQHKLLQTDAQGKLQWTKDSVMQEEIKQLEQLFGSELTDKILTTKKLKQLKTLPRLLAQSKLKAQALRQNGTALKSTLANEYATFVLNGLINRDAYLFGKKIVSREVNAPRLNPELFDEDITITFREQPTALITDPGTYMVDIQTVDQQPFTLENLQQKTATTEISQNQSGESSIMQINGSLAKAKPNNDTLLIYFHGGNGTSSRDSHDTLGGSMFEKAVQTAKSLGIDAVGFDSRGAGLSSGDYSTAGMEEWKDANAVIQWAIRAGYKNITTMGSSFGASTATHEAHKFPEVKVVWADSAFTDGKSFLEEMHKFHPVISKRIIPRVFAKGKEMGLYPEKMRPIDYVGIKQSPPMYFIAAGKDRFLSSPQYAEEFAKKAGAKGSLWNTSSQLRGKKSLLTRIFKPKHRLTVAEKQRHTVSHFAEPSYFDQLGEVLQHHLLKQETTPIAIGRTR